jgi:hypothetical protein
MADYRRPELDLSTRTTLALEMLKTIPERRWGRATQLAHTYGVSRNWWSTKPFSDGLSQRFLC